MKLSVTLIGSFRKDRARLKNIHSKLKKQYNLLAPRSIDFDNETSGFVKTKEEAEQSIFEIESKHLSAIAKSDLVVLHAPDGYVGNSASLEVGFAYALGIPVIADENPSDTTISAMVSGLLDDDGKDIPAVDSGRGLSGLQNYYERIAVRRGWDKESPKDTLLLLTEEVGELARAIRKTEGLKRADGYEGISTSDELADVQLYLVHLANTLSINLAEAVTQKEVKNAKKHIN